MRTLFVVLAAIFGMNQAQAQAPADYLTKVCEKNLITTVEKQYKKGAVTVTDVTPIDKAGNQVATYTGKFEVVASIEADECYEAWNVWTKIEYVEGKKTPSCTIKKITFKDRDCA